MSLTDRLAAFADAARTLLDSVVAADAPAHSIRTHVTTAIAGPLTAERSGAPSRKPACRHLARCLDLAASGPAASAALARAFAALEPDLTWVQNPNYSEAVMGKHYLDNYAYCDVIGPRGLVDHDSVAMGVLLLGPGLHYPDHDHAAEEIYVVLGGDALWSRDGDNWCQHPPGSVIHHPPWTRHAMKCGAEPLFAFYCWLGALDAPAQLLA